jgi:hypothetical protein
MKELTHIIQSYIGMNPRRALLFSNKMRDFNFAGYVGGFYVSLVLDRLCHSDFKTGSQTGLGQGYTAP